MNPEFSTPQWVHHAVFYQIFPDRFARSDKASKAKNIESWDSPPTLNGFKGGDIWGILEKLDYLQDLGINAIYLNPVFQSASNHRYHTHDYYKVDPLLGGNQALRNLIDRAHQRKIRIILDGVFNHASRGFFHFNHILELGKSSPYIDWFRIHKFPLNAYDGKPNYDCWWNIPALPEFNFEHHEVRSYILDIARYWINQGIDGWRLDVPFHINDELFWEEFRDNVKECNPEAYIVGEIPGDATRWLDGNQFDGVMNYPWAYACWGFFGGDGFDTTMIGNWITHAASHLQKDVKWFARQVEELLSYHPEPAVYAQLNMLDSHDTPRFLTMMNGNINLLRLATLFQMTYPGAPCIYYGNEIGMQGKNDPDCRRSFLWDETTWNHELRDYFKKCISLRKEYPCLSTGKYRNILAQDGLYIYLRSLEQEHALVIINRSQETKQIDIQIDTPEIKDGDIFTDQFSAAQIQIKESRFSGLSLPPISGALFIKNEK